MNYRDFLQKVIYVVINPIIRAMIRMGITPNVVTLVGFVGNLLATAFFIKGGIGLQQGDTACGMAWIGWGGLTILLAGLFDMMDGRLARLGNMSSTFGALWDSTLDRYSEMVWLFGVSVVFLSSGWFWSGIVTYAAILGSVMVSYVRARAEGLGIECKVGLLQRPERVVITAVVAIVSGCTANLWWMAAGMWVIAVLANLTACWRVAHCRRELDKRDGHRS